MQAYFCLIWLFCLIASCNSIPQCSQPCGPDASCVCRNSAPTCVCNPGFEGDGQVSRMDSLSNGAQRKRLMSTESHTVLFLDHSDTLMKSSSQPSLNTSSQARAQLEFVRMPCANRNETFAVQDEFDRRWKEVQQALTNCKFSSFDDIKDTILSYNPHYACKWNFGGLRDYIENTLEKREREILLKETLPKLARLALQLPICIKQPIPLLQKGIKHTVTMSQKQAACILANAFFCTFPRRTRPSPDAEHATYSDMNFSRLFTSTETCSAKLNCLFHYFSRIVEEMPKGVISFERRSVHQFPDWSKSATKFTKLQALSKGTIEDDGTNMLQVDFSNKYVGGGVFLARCVQEEIRFLMCPEMIVSRLFTEELEENESLTMIGCERYSQYTGYGRTFQWLKPYHDNSPRDDWGRRTVEVVAIDPKQFKLLNYPYGSQFVKKEVNRELNKAYCGFYNPSSDATALLSPVATGNWGCGGYGGDKELKSIIQYMAASEAGRDIVYFTFGDQPFMQDLTDVYELLKENELTIGYVCNLIQQYYDKIVKPSMILTPKPTTTLFDFILSIDFKKLKSRSSCIIS